MLDERGGHDDHGITQKAMGSPRKPKKPHTMHEHITTAGFLEADEWPLGRLLL